MAHDFEVESWNSKNRHYFDDTQLFAEACPPEGPRALAEAAGDLAPNHLENADLTPPAQQHRLDHFEHVKTGWEILIRRPPVFGCSFSSLAGVKLCCSSLTTCESIKEVSSNYSTARVQSTSLRVYANSYFALKTLPCDVTTCFVIVSRRGFPEKSDASCRRSASNATCNMATQFTKNISKILSIFL